MKKQLFSFLMVLALVVLAGTSAMAQTSGLLPGTAKEIVRGSTVRFEVTDASAGAGIATTHDWDVYTIATTANLNAAGTAATAATDYSFVTDQTGTTVAGASTTTVAFIKFLTRPAAGNVFMVEYTGSSAGTCSTKRRFFLSVFDFNVDVVLSDNTGALIAGYNADADHSECSTWDGNVIQNGTTADYFEGADLTAPHADYVNNGNDNEPKYTEKYFAVTITLSGNSSMDLDDIKWRFRYSLFDDIATATDVTADADLSLFGINSQTTGAAFGSGGAQVGGTNDAAVTIVASAFDANSGVYVAPTSGTAGAANVTADQTATYVFRVRTHNILGGNDQTWGIRLDEVQLETTTASSDYSNGRKVHSAIAVAGVDVALTDGRTDTYTIRQTPATGVIRVQD